MCDLGIRKALGPDGFILLSFNSIWTLLKLVFQKVFEELYFSDKVGIGIYPTFMTLICKNAALSR